MTLEEIEALYRDRYGAFLRVALALLRDRDLARDAVQETFARAVRARRRVRGEAWLWQVLANHCRDVLRSSARSPAGAEPSPNGHPPDWQEVRAAVARLPERQRLVLFLRHYADLDYDTIAEVTGVARGTVAATLHAAHAAVRRSIEEEEAG
jgi:RNA polymerase sigma-70 factor (ECF subfamily)